MEFFYHVNITSSSKAVFTAENFGHLRPHGSSGFSQSIIKMAYIRNYKQLLTENKTSLANDVFQFAKIEYHSETFQHYFS